MAMRRLFFIAIFSVALNSLCSHFALGAAASKIILGYASPGRALSFWVAQDIGLFNKYGVDVELVFIRGAPILVAGLAAGDIEPSGMTDAQILDSVDATMSSVVGKPIKRVAGFVKSWTHDPWSRAVVRAPIGDQRDTVLPLIAAPLDGRVFFAGEHTDNRVGPGGMEGAIKSGYRVAREVLA